MSFFEKINIFLFFLFSHFYFIFNIIVLFLVFFFNLKGIIFFYFIFPIQYK